MAQVADGLVALALCRANPARSFGSAQDRLPMGTFRSGFGSERWGPPAVYSAYYRVNKTLDVASSPANAVLCRKGDDHWPMIRIFLISTSTVESANK